MLKLIILILPCILAMRVLRMTKDSYSSSRVELLETDIKALDSFTICGRFRNPLMPGLDNSWQEIFYRTKMYLLGAMNVNNLQDNAKHGDEQGVYKLSI